MPSSPDPYSARCSDSGRRGVRSLRFFFRRPSALAIVALLFLITATADPQANVPSQADAPVWTRLKIKEAFISRATSEKFRDAFSAAEFGWKILDSKNKVLARGTLYSDLFFPFPPDFAPADESGAVRLALIERDVFEDDRVASVSLRPGVNRYELTEAGDFVQLERVRVEPDRASGGDANPGGAQLMRTDELAGSVDFRAGDYTDYLRLPDNTGAVLLLRDRFTLNWDLPGLISTEESLHSRFSRVLKADGSSRQNGAGPTASTASNVPFVFTAGGSGVVVLDFDSDRLSGEAGGARDATGAAGDQPILLRLRGRIGAGKQLYRIFRTPRGASSTALLEKWLAFVRSQKPNPSQFNDDPAIAAIAGSTRRGSLAEAFLAYDADASAKLCRRKLGPQTLHRARPAGIASGSGRDQERVFCAHLLYKRELPEDRRRLLQSFNGESKFYQDSLKYVNRRAEREAAKADEARKPQSK
ncbi:MAG: hypothetical protein NXI24_13950 [bacterium]|nr:hypothetical protein [bacterium]